MTKKNDNNWFAKQVLTWFDQHGRKDLPWQQNKTPYRVWVSEIMLQQTQVSSVIDYYLRFMSRFPTLQSLAEAHEDTVLKFWAGLGYYARARNLHKTAKVIVNDRNGDFPNNIEEIISLPGIGPSTAGAILCIAFNSRAPILDGNVKRVLCRFEAIHSWSGESKTETALWHVAEQYTPRQRVGAYTQAIMDLGATLCTRSNPACTNCPLQKRCKAYSQGLQKLLPISKPKKVVPVKHTWMAHIESDDGYILLEKRPPSGIWGGLYSLPELDSNLPMDSIIKHCNQRFEGQFNSAIEQAEFTHTFSHYRLKVKPITLRTQSRPDSIRSTDNYRWIKLSQLKQFGLPAPVSKYLLKTVHTNLDLQLT